MTENILVTSESFNGAWNTDPGVSTVHSFHPWIAVLPTPLSRWLCFNLPLYSLSGKLALSPSRAVSPVRSLHISCQSSFPRLCPSPLLDSLSTAKICTGHGDDRPYAWLLSWNIFLEFLVVRLELFILTIVWSYGCCSRNPNCPG